MKSKIISVLGASILLVIGLPACRTCETEDVSGSLGDLESRTTAFSMIADKDTSEYDVSRAVSYLGPGPAVEAAGFWAERANDTGYTLDRRRRFVFLLFRRHVEAGLTLGQVAKRLDKPNWLPDQCIRRVDILSGLIPVKITSGDTTVQMVILPPKRGDFSAVYLRIKGEYQADEIGRVLRGDEKEGSVTEAKVEEIGYAEYE